MNFKIGIIGCGLIGYKRAKSLGPKGKLVACADPNISQAKRIVRNKKIKVKLSNCLVVELPVLYH